MSKDREQPLSLGTIVSISTPQGRGVVRFYGTTSFQIGKWVGIELNEPIGKNDGSVQGVSYFTCRPNHGVFIRPSKIIATHGSELDAQRSPVVSARSGSHQRTPSSSSLLRTNSIRSQVSSASASSASSPRSASPVRPPPLTSPLLTTPRASRQASSPTKRNSANLATPTSARKPINFRQPSVDNESQSRAAASKRPSSPLVQPPITASPPTSSSLSAQLSSAGSHKPPSRPTSPVHHPQDEQELQELRAKIRVLEARRADDARHMRELEKRLEEAEAWVAYRPKLQAKLTTQQTELIELKRELADAQQLTKAAETRITDSQDQLELAMLDREVAEERAEIAEATVEELKEQLAMMKVENDVLNNEDNAGESNPAKDSLAFIQLEKQNERLKEALIRLRDMSAETEQEQRHRIAEMERDVDSLDEVQAQYEEALNKLSNAESEIEGLKLQIDDALGAEDLLVQLTERNLELGEKIEGMRITIEEYEMLQEVNEELEHHYQETEKKLHNDIEAKEGEIRALNQKIAALDETCLDYDGTITQFRELVMHLQTELDQLRNQTQTAQSEVATAASQTAAMMSLNLKLQSSASKNQARTIELEVKRLEAKEARELLGIVQPYLPQIYIETDTDATSCYLLFQRLGAKADLVSTIVAQAHNLPEALNGPVTEGLVGVCEMRGRISNLSTLCKRFAAVLRRTDVETFLNIGRIYPDIAPLEKRLDMHLDLLRRDEFREMECVSDVMKIQAQFEHLAETYFTGYDHDLAERELGYVLALDHDLDMCGATLGLTKTSIDGIVKDEDLVKELGGYDVDQALFTPLQTVLDQCRSAKSLSRKLIKRIEDLSADSAAVKAHLVPQMKGLSNSVDELAGFAISLAQQVMPHLSDVRSAKSPFQLSTILSIVKETASSTVAKDLKPGGSVWEAISAYVSRLMEDGNKLLPLTMEAENIQKITGTSPWITRVAEIKAALAVNVEAERKVAQLNEEMQGLARTVRSRDQALQESAVKIEMMERRMEAAKKQAEAIVELEAELGKIKKQERAYEEALEQLQTDLDAAEQENAKMATALAGQEKAASGVQVVDQPDAVPVEGSLETSYLLEQIEALRGTVRFLRSENNFLKGQDLIREIEALTPAPVVRTRASATPTPPLVASGNSDTGSDTDELDDDEPAKPPTLRTLAAETKMLYRDVIRFSSSPTVVDLSELNKKRQEMKSTKVWMPRKKMPAQQVLERKLEGERLSRRVHGLMERANLISSL